MRVVYVAGPYRAPTMNGVKRNIRKAEMVAEACWLAGVAAVCPHLNTAFFDGLAPDSTWLKGDLEIMRRCDAVVMVPGWTCSEGSRAAPVGVCMSVPETCPAE